jgi:hypothetical protein
MKKQGKRTWIVFIGLWVIGLLIAQSAKAGPPLPGHIQLLPDLAVRLKLVTKKTSCAGGKVCYSTMPEYTVTNLGQGAAKNFEVKMYRKVQDQSPGKAFQFWGSSGKRSLAPGRSWTYRANPIDENVWFADKSGKVGYKVVVVYGGREKTKNNNTDVKLFPMFHVPY